MKLAGLKVPALGAVLSMRIWTLAVLTVSAFPATSTEKYLIVYVPSALRLIDVPCAEFVVGIAPFVV